MKILRRGAGAVAFSAVFALSTLAHGAEITPFRTVNMSPVVQIFGLPAIGTARLLPKGGGEASLVFDAANNFAIDQTQREQVVLDGETYRLALGLRYGIAKGIEGGIEVPFIFHSGGELDGFVEWFHSSFGFDTGGRDQVPEGRLLYTYSRDGVQQFRVDHPNGGIGDIRLTTGIRLYDDESAAPRALALRAALKLPTGNSGKLRGSGSVDGSLWLTGSDDYRLGGWGHATIFAAAGGMVMSKGDVLKDQQKSVAAFGSLGAGWSPFDWFALKVQTNWHSSLYRGSTLRELDFDTLQIIGGGTIAFPTGTALDLGVSEDLNVKTSPDVVFHLALTQRF
ncbi:DUF3187 family protein [Geobacter pickeringii]|uniref:DUF3187 family protein n=1 Tax=Geobacter pickeringii TaxID=345632 RepID=A0A0B5BCM7_9BACT|nr:DUF3187 family protein [Geobacter pickeringii]AJE02325.1 hypothetical protein GPICK_02085 [Geobacter pickeringii]